MNTENPREILGVGPEAGDEEIRAAYLRKVKEFPPDRAPSEFERVRGAYDALRGGGGQSAGILAAAPGQPLDSLLDGLRPERRFAGPGPWLAALMEKKR